MASTPAQTLCKRKISLHIPLILLWFGEMSAFNILYGRLADGDCPPPLSEGKTRRELSIREREAAILIAVGLSNQEVADRMGISVKTVEKHRQAVYNKLKVDNASALTIRLIDKGILSLSNATAFVRATYPEK